MKNYYSTLEITKDADPAEIKKAYFKLIRRYSPEKEPDKFKEIREAYENLQNDNYRKEFERIQKIPSPFKEVYQCARDYEKKNQFQSAINTCREGLAVDPKQIELNLYLARLYLNNEKPGKAIKILEKCLKDNDDASGRIDGLLAIAYEKRGWNKKAAVQFEKSYHMGTRDEEFIILYAQNLYYQEKYEPAKTLLLELLDSSPSGISDSNELNRDLFTYLALVYLQLGSHEKGEFYKRMEAFMEKTPGKSELCKKLLVHILVVVTEEFHIQEHNSDILKDITALLKRYKDLSQEQSLHLYHGEFLIEETQIYRDQRIGETIEEAAGLFFSVELMKNNLPFIYEDVEIALLEMKLIIIDEFKELKIELDIIVNEYPLLNDAMKDFLNELGRNDNKAFLFSKYEKKYCKLAGYPSGSHLVRNREEWDESDEGTEEEYDEFWRQEPYRREGSKVGRNDPCPCGSGKKYKKCCGK